MKLEIGVLEELRTLEKLAKRYSSIVKLETLAEVEFGKWKLPVYGIVIGSQEKTAPTFGLFGGVHGIERVGARVVVAYIHNLLTQLSWDRGLHRRLEESRFISIPVINPGGVALAKRGNPRGVDLMRNAPIDADGRVTFLVGGHRISRYLPWYRGRAGDAMEKESQAVFDFVKREAFESRALMTLDVHSGFGLRDRLWYPYAKTTKRFPGFIWAKRFKRLLNRGFREHVYRIEPQARHYVTHGDLWDYLFDESQNLPNRPGYLPLTLEMGSWLWVRKNPIQLLSYMGIFNPVLPHRERRVYRRHQILIDFIWRATRNWDNWNKPRE